MERLTDKRMKGEGFIPVDRKEYKQFARNEKPTEKQIYQRLLEIEGILGNDYDLDRLRELVEADREGRCVVLPAGGYTDKDGEKAPQKAMFVLSHTNNVMNRYIADAIAEKLTREEAALKGEQDG